MVQADINENTGNGTIVLKPNNSATWGFNVAVISSLAFIACLISGFFLIQGLWLILPFSGMEILLFYVCLTVCVRRNKVTEVITFHDNTVIIEKGRTHAEDSWEYQRSWSKIFIKAPEHRGHPKRIFIRSHGKELELGAFLNKQDKENFISRLKNVVYCRNMESVAQAV
jgi:uncharacterized membrane protein